MSKDVCQTNNLPCSRCQPVCEHRLKNHVTMQESYTRLDRWIKYNKKMLDGTPWLRAHNENMLAALGKQIPKKPKTVLHDGENDWWQCPTCGNTSLPYGEHHCKCGQALNWR